MLRFVLVGLAVAGAVPAQAQMPCPFACVRIRSLSDSTYVVRFFNPTEWPQRLTIYRTKPSGYTSAADLPLTLTVAPGDSLDATTLLRTRPDDEHPTASINYDRQGVCQPGRVCVETVRTEEALRFVARNPLPHGIATRVVFPDGAPPEAGGDFVEAWVEAGQEAALLALPPDAPMPTWQRRWWAGRLGQPDSLATVPMPFAPNVAVRVEATPDDPRPAWLPPMPENATRPLVLDVADGTTVRVVRDGVVRSIERAPTEPVSDTLRLPDGSLRVERRTGFGATVHVAHNDGTLAQYGSLAAEGLPEAGQRLHVGQTLGTVADGQPVTLCLQYFDETGRLRSIPARFNVDGTVRRLRTGDAFRVR